MKISQLLDNQSTISVLSEAISRMQDQMGYWDQEQKKWVGYRYSGFPSDNLVFGNLTFDQHVDNIFSHDTEKADEIKKLIRSPQLRNIVAMALNGYTGIMILEKIKPDYEAEDIGRHLNSINAQLTQTRKKTGLPIPLGLATKYGAVLEQALELKKKWYRPGNSLKNSDKTVAEYLARHGSATPDSIESLLSGYRKQMRDKKIPIPPWLETPGTKLRP